MTKPPMPKITGDGEGCGGRTPMVTKKRVKIARTIGAHDDLPGEEILQGETKRVKFNRAVVIANKFASGTKVLDNGGRNKNIIKMEGARC